MGLPLSREESGRDERFSDKPVVMPPEWAIHNRTNTRVWAALVLHAARRQVV
jgi:hypothetical protein